MRLADMGIACHGGSHSPQGSFGVLFLYVLYGGVYLHFKKIIRLVCFSRDVKNVFTVHILRPAQQLAVEEDICYGVYPVEFQQQCLGGKHFFRQRETALINAVSTADIGSLILIFTVIGVFHQPVLHKCVVQRAGDFGFKVIFKLIIGAVKPPDAVKRLFHIISFLSVRWGQVSVSKLLSSQLPIKKQENSFRVMFR